MKSRSLYICIFFSFLIIACNDNDAPGNDNGTSVSTPVISYSIVNALPHDTSSFTQGLEFYNGTLLESTGNWGKSKLIQHDLQTGKVLQQLNLDAKFFGEGLTVLRDTIYQLTYKEKTVLVYTAKDFKKIAEIPFNTEGWGITNDGTNLIVSDGSSNLYFYEPFTFKLLRTQGITENGTPLVNINELEYINGYVYANQWQYNYIAKIDPTKGEVVGKMDLSDVVNKIFSQNPALRDVGGFLNGIAYDSTSNKIFITGKLWPQIYEINFPH